MRIRARTNARARISSVRRPEIAEIASDACRSGSGCCARQFCETCEKRIHFAHKSALRWGAEPSSPREGDGSLPIRLPDRLAIPFLEPQSQPQQEGEEGEAAQEGQEGPKAPIRLSDRFAIPVLEPQSQPQQEGEEGQAGQEGQERPKASEASEASEAEAKVPLLVQEQEQEQEQERKEDRGRSRPRSREASARGPDPIPPRARRIARNPPTRASSRDDDRCSAGRATIVATGRADRGTEDDGGTVATRRRAWGLLATRTIALPEASPRTRPREGRSRDRGGRGGHDDRRPPPAHYGHDRADIIAPRGHRRSPTDARPGGRTGSFFGRAADIPDGRSASP